MQVLGAGVAIYAFDQQIQRNLKAKLEEDLDNPYLKGGAAADCMDWILEGMRVRAPSIILPGC